ncbi:MAG: pyridoxine 5'-phosphate synthase [Candidatus Omnitrophica bacterium]|nr:pyridoxine 5'-phosphate synthase [Candidatus Omnitrophota bacterium]
MPKLGVNIDHIATVRQARKGKEPDPVEAARICEEAGCDSIVCHLREDRRHIQDDDVRRLRKSLGTRLNLEMSIASAIVEFACRIRPDQATLVPERRQELTTEGGLDVARGEKRIRAVVGRLAESGIETSLFIDPEKLQIDASKRVGAGIIELHTGEYANAKPGPARNKQLAKLKRATSYARSLGLEVNAGHGLDYVNVRPVAAIEDMNELNIGYSIISKALFSGLDAAVREMKELAR